MTSNLALALTAGVTSVGSYNDGTTFEWTPTSCSTNGACAMNGNTVSASGYYSWYAATAEKGQSTDIDVDIDGSICARGWTMPAHHKFDSTHSYAAITRAYFNFETGSIANYVSVLENFPLSFARSYWFENGARNTTDYRGEYWTSTAQELHAESAWRLYYRTSDTYTTGYARKHFGLSIRCVAL